MFDWSSPFIDRFLKISVLRFYPGATPGEKGNQLQLTMKTRKQKKEQVYENNRPNRKCYSKWQTDRPWLDFNKEKISNPFISSCSSLRALTVRYHGEALRCRRTTYKRVPIEKSTPASIVFDTQTDIIESVQETVFINND